MATEVFLSYAREDRDSASLVARALEQHGLTVSWDRELAPGANWHNVIGKALEAASAVIVLWSVRSVESSRVLDEADSGRQQGKLIPVLVDNVNPPLGFGQFQSADLTSWDGSPKAPEFALLLTAVVRLTGQPPSGPVPDDSPGETIGVDPTTRYKRLPGASRTKVFVAHATADKPRLRPILMTLIDQGFPLWVDKPQQIGLGAGYETRLAADRIQYGQDWRESIRVAVARSDAVLAFWSHDAVNGRREQFHYEVYMGMMQRKLSQCRIDQVSFPDIGMPYTFDHIADLSTMSEGAYHPDLDYLMQDMSARKRAWWRLW